MRYCKRLTQLRVENGYTVERLATILQVDKELIERWEDGTVEPTLRQLNQLLALYEIPIEEVLDDASMYIEIEQAIELTPDNKRRHVVGVTGKNDDIESLYYHDIDALKASIAKNAQKKQVSGQHKTDKDKNIPKNWQKFWANVLFLMSLFSLFALLPILITKKPLWSLFVFVPVVPCLLWAVVQKNKNFLATCGLAILFTSVIVIIGIFAVR